MKHTEKSKQDPNNYADEGKFMKLNISMNTKHSKSSDGKFISNNNEQYYKEEKRLESFSNWPAHFPVNPLRLAKSGFYYCGNGDEVICFSCGGYISNWQFGDIVQKRHKELYPNCSFVNNKSNNIALVTPNTKQAASSTVSSDSSSSSSDVCGKCNSSTNMCVDHGSSNKSSNSSKATKPVEDSSHCYGNNRVPLISTKSTKTQPHEIQKMTSIEERLKSFNSDWVLLSPSVQDFAAAGFFFLGDGDKVQCAFCLGVIKDWAIKDVPLSEHVRHFPDCKYVKKLLDQKTEHTSIPQPQPDDGNGVYAEEVCCQSASAASYKLINKSQPHTKLKEHGSNLLSSSIHPNQSTFTARLRTFLAWPSTVPVSKESLAAAGFFYIGISDYTKCFCCDGGLCSWEPEDDPWVEHARWFPYCSFLKLNKDEGFIKKCTKVESSVGSVLKEEQLNPPDNSLNCSSNLLICKLEEAMKSSLIATVVKTGIYPPYLIRAAVFQQLKNNGIPFATTEELCDAVNVLKAKLKATAVANNQEKTKGISTFSGSNQIQCGISNTSETEACQSSSYSGNNDSKLEDENRFLKDQHLCKICMDNDVSVVFLPCGHLLACTFCAPPLSNCPMCRQSIQATVRAYLP